MAVGTLALACLWLSLGQAPAAAEVTHSGQRNLKIPINVSQDARRNEISEVRLFASSDQGRSFQQVGAIAPDKDGFAFYAPRDGTYWLRVAMVNRQGKQEPENVSAGPPDQIMVIDTQKPVIRSFEARPQGDEVILGWDIQEDNPDGATFRVEYQPKNGTSWTPVAIGRPALSGQDKFRPPTGGPLTVRLTMRDLAGNESLAFADLHGGTPVAAATFNNPPFAATPTASNAPPPPLSASMAVPTAPPAMPPISLAAQDSTFHQTLSQSAVPELTSRISIPTREGPTPPPMLTQTLQVPPALQPQTVPVQAPPSPTVAAPAPVAAAAPPPAAAPMERVIADTQWTPPPVAVPAPKRTPALMPETSGSGLTPVTISSRRALPPLQYVNKPAVTLEFELSKIGPSGIKSIHLWCTHDDGATWPEKEYAYDEKTSDIQPNTRQRRSVPLAVDGVEKEGIYGFQIRVKSNSDLISAAPKAGDLPEMRVELDTTAPKAMLYAPSADRHRPNTLMLKWKAEDKNLGPTPVTLEWSEHRHAEWKPIAVDIPNDGSHAWALPEKMPVQVYLRLRVRDLAGNESIAATRQPEYVDLTEPEGHLINVSFPAPGRKE